MGDHFHGNHMIYWTDADTLTHIVHQIRSVQIILKIALTKLYRIDIKVKTIWIESEAIGTCILIKLISLSSLSRNDLSTICVVIVIVLVQVENYKVHFTFMKLIYDYYRATYFVNGIFSIWNASDKELMLYRSVLKRVTVLGDWILEIKSYMIYQLVSSLMVFNSGIHLVSLLFLFLFFLITVIT